MFLRYFEPLFWPIRWVRGYWMKARNVQGRFRVDVGRVKNYKKLAKSKAQEAKRMAGQAKQKAGQAAGQARQKAAGMQARLPGRGGAQVGPAAAAAGGAMPGAMPAAAMAGGPMQGRPMAYHPQPGQPGGGAHGGGGAYAGGGSGPGPQVAPGPAPGYARGPAGGPASLNGTNGIVVTGALWWKKHLCAQCGQQLDRTWDRCPFCAGSAPVVGSLKTQAIQLDAAGVGNGLQLCGWLVALKGPQRGELFTLDPLTSVGTDQGCTVVLSDQYMSSRHCEIRAEGGIWMLRDLKSTNGTFVNDKRVEQHELVDSDFLRLGQVVLKFKSL
jgi:hypothetical protein